MDIGRHSSKKGLNIQIHLIYFQKNYNSSVQFSFAGSRHKSLVMTPEHPDLIFTLELIHTEPTYEQPEQTWRFTSDFAVS